MRFIHLFSVNRALVSQGGLSIYTDLKLLQEIKKTAESEGFSLCLPTDMKTFFGAEIYPGSSQGTDVNSSPECKF